MNRIDQWSFTRTQHRKDWTRKTRSFRITICSREYRYDRNVRITVQLFLLHIWPSLLHVQQHDLVKEIIEKHRRLAYKERRPRFCTNSLEHRLMFRALQCLLCLTAVIKDSVRETGRLCWPIMIIGSFLLESSEDNLWLRRWNIGSWEWTIASSSCWMDRRSSNLGRSNDTFEWFVCVHQRCSSSSNRNYLCLDIHCLSCDQSVDQSCRTGDDRPMSFFWSFHESLCPM